MCSCNVPTVFLNSLEDYNLPHLPKEIVDKILICCKSYTRCPECMKVVAKSVNSECNLHCRPFIRCIDCCK